jgi:hypothetical protein
MDDKTREVMQIIYETAIIKKDIEKAPWCPEGEEHIWIDNIAEVAEKVVEHLSDRGKNGT